jgi:uncharacterized surface protein with fasciclin (FAS1) repeats
MILGAGVMALTLSACGSEDGGGDPVAGYDDSVTDSNDVLAPLGEPIITQDIIEIASANPELALFIDGLGAAGLTTLLNGDGPYTVFAPTNIAFEKEGAPPPDVVVNTVEDTAGAAAAIPKKDMSGRLRYHIVEGVVLAEDLKKMLADGNGAARLKTLHGGELTVRDQNGTMILVDATNASTPLSLTDIEASNGVIHTIDTVMKPAP